MEKNKITELLYQNKWLNEIIIFMKKASKMNDAQLELIINGTKPEITEALEKQLEEETKNIIETFQKEPTETTKEQPSKSEEVGKE